MYDRQYDAALAAYRVVHPDGPAFSTLSDIERERWRNAYGVARRIEPVVTKMSPAYELNEATFNYARNVLGGTPPHMVTLYGSPTYSRVMRELAEKYGCAFVELPAEAYVTTWTWRMHTGDGIVWSAATC